MKSSSSIALFCSLLGCIFSFFSFLICFSPPSSLPSPPSSSPSLFFFHLPRSFLPGPPLYRLSRPHSRVRVRFPFRSAPYAVLALVHSFSAIFWSTERFNCSKLSPCILSRPPRRRRLPSHVPQKEERLTTSCMSFIHILFYFFVPTEISRSESHQLLTANANELFTV